VYSALPVFVTNMQTKFGVIETYGDKVELQKRNALHKSNGNYKTPRAQFEQLW